MIRNLLLSALFLAALSGCFEDTTSPEAKSYPFAFKLNSLPPEGLALDSLSVRIETAETTVTLAYDWKTGKSQGSVSAEEGHGYKIGFAVFACAFKVGSGEDTGTFEQNKQVVLHVNWDSTAVGNAKMCRIGACVPPDLKNSFDLALAGKAFDFPASCDSGATYRWSVIRRDTVLFSGESPSPSFVMPDSLKGSDVTVRIQILADGRITESRVLSVKVLAHLAEGKLIGMTIRSDTTSAEGTRFEFAYDASGRLAEAALFDTLFPAASSKPLALDSLFYDSTGRLRRSRFATADGMTLDSSFRYDGSGNLIALRVAGATSETLDSLVFGAGKPVLALRYVSGTLRDSMVSLWKTDTCRDSVFSFASGGLSLARVVERLYRSDSLAERRIWINQGGLQPFTKEVFVYNGIGKRGYRQAFTVGQNLILEETDSYRYDDGGRLASYQKKDEVSGELLQAVSYEYAGTAALAKVAAGFPGLAGGNVLDNLRFDYEGWRKVLPPHRSH